MEVWNVHGRPKPISFVQQQKYSNVVQSLTAHRSWIERRSERVNVHPCLGNEFSGRSSGCQDTQASLSALWLALQIGASSAVTSVERLEGRRRTTRCAGHGI